MEHEPTLFELNSSPPTKSALPSTYLEWLKREWLAYPSNVRISRRLIPLKHSLIFLISLLVLSALCYVLGLAFWRLAVPSKYSTQRADAITRFIAGWFMVTIISLFGIGLKFIWGIVAVILCGKGLEKQI